MKKKSLSEEKNEKNLKKFEKRGWQTGNDVVYYLGCRRKATSRGHRSLKIEQQNFENKTFVKTKGV